MAYKDKDKQREAQREWVRQKRKGSTLKGSTKQGSTKDVTGITEADKELAASDQELTGLMAAPKQVFPKTVKFPTHKCITIDDQAKSMKTMAMLHSDACKRAKPQSHNSMMVGYVPPKR